VDGFWIECTLLSSQNSIEFKFAFLSSTVQGSHRDSSKQNKDLAMLSQHSNSNNLNSPSSLSGSKNVAVVEAEVNRNGPYFDVAASKNVCINFCEGSKTRFYGRMI
jgi:hypothetical protein